MYTHTNTHRQPDAQGLTWNASKLHALSTLVRPDGYVYTHKKTNKHAHINTHTYRERDTHALRLPKCRQTCVCVCVCVCL